MQVILNGEPTEVAAATLETLLVELDFGGAVVATAVNGDFVPVRRRGAQQVVDGDRIEIVAPMQGG